jgi:hypothetical protein
MLLFVIIFILRLRSIIRINNPKGEQYTIANEPIVLDIIKPINDIGCNIVYRYIGVEYMLRVIVPL